MFSFRKPFSAQVWFAVAVAMLFSAVTYFFIVKLEEVGTDDFEENVENQRRSRHKGLKGFLAWCLRSQKGSTKDRFFQVHICRQWHL